MAKHQSDHMLTVAYPSCMMQHMVSCQIGTSRQLADKVTHTVIVRPQRSHCPSVLTDLHTRRWFNSVKHLIGLMQITKAADSLYMTILYNCTVHYERGEAYRSVIRFYLIIF